MRHTEAPSITRQFLNMDDYPFEMTAISLIGCSKNYGSAHVFISRGFTVLSPAANFRRSDVIAFLLRVRADPLIASKYVMRAVTTSFNPIENHSGDSLAAVNPRRMAEGQC